MNKNFEESKENSYQSEIQKFNELANSWWNPHGKMRPLHDINPLRITWLRDLIGGFSGKRILDVGCGGGILSESIAKFGGSVTGLDLSENLIEIAKLHQVKSNVQIEYFVSSAEDFSEIRFEHYDVVICMEVLEHIPDPISIVQSCSKLVKPGGWVFFSTFNRNIKSFLFGIIGAEYILNLLPCGTHSYDSFIKPSELANLSRKAGLETKEIKGICYNPIRKKYFLSHDVSVNYLMATKK